MAHNNIQEMLDRGVANPKWNNLFPNFSLKHCMHSISDHCPILLNICRRVDQQEQSTCEFRFEATLLLEESCKREVKRLWNSSDGSILDIIRYVERGLMNWA